LSYNADTNALTASTFSGALIGNASSATQLQTSRTFTITGVVDAPAVSFNGTGNVELVTTLDDNAITNSKIANGAVSQTKINFQTALVPIGGIIMWSGSTTNIPTGYQLCNGSNGTPDLRNRFIVGAGSGYGVGATGGAATIQLTQGQLPSHAHGIGGDGNHNHLVVTAVEDSGGNRFTRLVDNGSLPHIVRTGFPSGNQNFRYAIRGTSSGPNAGRSNNAGSHSHGGATGAAGSNQAHENRPPYYALAYIMRTS
jgi:microcystin-dependent protein